MLLLPSTGFLTQYPLKAFSNLFYFTTMYYQVLCIIIYMYWYWVVCYNQYLV